MTDCTIFDLDDLRAQRRDRRTREAMTSNPVPLGPRKGDRITLTDSQRQCVVLGLTEEGKPVCCVDGVRRVLGHGSWSALS